MVFVCLICERSFCGFCRMKYIYNLLIVYYEIVVYREYFGKINIEEICMVYYENRCDFYCKICKCLVCFDCYIVYWFYVVLLIE